MPASGIVWIFIALLPWSPAWSATPQELEEGRMIYERHCADCHGMEGRGDGKLAASLSPRPGNFVSAQTSAKSDQDLLKVIAKGRPRTAMQGWNDRLSEKEQLAALAYIRSLVRFSRSSTTPPPTR